MSGENRIWRIASPGYYLAEVQSFAEIYGGPEMFRGIAAIRKEIARKWEARK